MANAMTDKKLSNFKTLIMKEIDEKKAGYEKELEEYKKTAKSSATNEALQKAYDIIQREKNAAIKQRHEKVSKIAGEKKKELLIYRDELLNKVYQGLCKKLDTYRKTPEYAEFMVKVINDGKSVLGDGVIVQIDAADEFLKEALESETGVKIEISETQLLGGAKIKSMTKNMLCNNSLAEKLEEHKTEFFEKSGLFI